MILSIVNLWDDAIVDVEKNQRISACTKIGTLTADYALDEVGNPTIQATLRILRFVADAFAPADGPYKCRFRWRVAAMLFFPSRGVIVSPWLAYIVLKNVRHNPEENEQKGIARYYKNLSPLIDVRKKREVALSVILRCFFSRWLRSLKAGDDENAAF